MNPLQKYNAHKSLQFCRLRSDRFGENGLTDACRAVFQKQAALKSHAFLFCHEPLQPSTRCGELRGGLSSRVSAAAGLSALTDEKPRSLDLQSGVIVAHVPADYKSRRNIKDSRAETPKPTMPKHRSMPRRSRPAGSIGLRGGSYCRRPGSVRGWEARRQQIPNLLQQVPMNCKSGTAK